MEFKLTKKKATICLNMIVKNESHIIENTLEKLCKKISFDYWVICDTGSTDDTPQIITDFFKNKGIKGELFHDEWINFAYNRTLALERAYKKTDLLFVFDADDEIVGDIVLPSEVLYDEYHLKFGFSSGVSYTRVLLINNHKRFQYLSVIHEFINCKEGPSTHATIEGDYYVISGRTGNRSLDPDKYLKDAIILEKAYEEAFNKNDQLFHRYAFYCANSYKDCGKYENAIKWYKITLSHEKQWAQEKYVSCLYIFDCLNALNRKEEGFFYLVKSFVYDNERLECLFPLLVHYCCENSAQVAYNYYLIVKDYFENHYLKKNITNKLFLVNDKYNFFVPYYMILIADKVQDFKCVIKMYEIVFIKKQRMFEDWYIKNFLYNLQFFLQHVSDSNLSNFVIKANDYIHFLVENGVQIQNYDFLNKDVYRNAGINFDKYIINPVLLKPQYFSKQECSQSKNILIYTGFSDIDWNYTYTLNNALGGSEKAVAYLSKCFPKDYTIYISGHVKNETIDNIHYIHLDELTNLINSTPFHSVIVSRYISFYEMFPNCSFYQSYIWAHDVQLLPYGSNLNENQILKKWNNYIDGCICLTEWHKTLFLENYSILKDKITIINNGIDIDSFTYVTNNNKIKNRFIYTSRPDRGLNNLLELWPQIIEKIPDATLTISSYGTFPSNPDEKVLKNIIDANPNTIRYLGKLNTEKLYEEMNQAEFWLYPTHWPETSCITALEMLMSKVICLYYPVAGLTNTMDKYGIQVCSGKEIETIVSLSQEQKNKIMIKSKEYALSCSWENRYTIWHKILFDNEDKNTIYNDEKIKKRIYELYYNNCIPSEHVNFLKKLKHEYEFEPKVIYDIGANVLHWTREAKNIWTNSDIIVFDAIKTAKFLYEEQNLKHYIGVLSDEDNKVVRFYENLEHPAGNSYYQEIGHPNSKFLFSDNSYNEQISTTLTKAVYSNNFPYPDLIKMDVQGAELDIIKGSLDIINKAQYLIVELQHTQYNKGAPLCDVTISFLNKNGWKLIAEKFSDNGADADYCFINTNYKKWLFFIEPTFRKEYINDYIDSLNSVHNIEITSDISYIFKNKIHKVSFILIDYIQKLNYTDIINKLVNDNTEISIINTEPLNLEIRLKLLCDNYNFLQNFVSYPIIIYDYSLSNIRILNETNIKNTIHLGYIPYHIENDFLSNLYKNTEKIYDFGIISEFNPICCERRRHVVEYLISVGYTVNIISGWKENRDKQLAKCKTILNIHGEFIYTSVIFEHIRCDRLLHAGFQILSETSLYLDDEFINKFPNLRFINYEDFFKKETYISNYYIKKNKVIDCFIFYNELELLDYRLHLLNDVVDYFILVESTKTFIGKDKPLIYYQNKELFSKFNEKIIHIIVDDMPFDETNINVSNGDQWVNEKFQRNCISRGFNKINFENNDIITICDLDEIPDPIVLLDLKNSNQDIGIQILELDFYYYNLNCKRREKWYHTKVLSYKKYIELNTTCENIRFSSGSTIKKAGWHLSYFGDVNFIKNKINNFSHQEYNNETYTNIEKLQKIVETCSDLYERSCSEMDNIDIKDNDYLPPLYNIYLKNYYKKSINYQDIDYVTNENNNF